jgi:hypothetical protein
MSSRPHIDGEEKLTAIFGDFPDFGDAEVWSISFERTTEGIVMVTSTMHVHALVASTLAWIPNRNPKYARVTFRFTDCDAEEVGNFNHQNVLSSLRITHTPEAKKPFSVRFGPCYGFNGTLTCGRIEVVDASPWTPPHEMQAPT